MSEQQCATCGGKEDFDARLALNRMALKNEQLAAVMQRFMAGVVHTSGPERAALAVEDRTTLLAGLSRELARIVGGQPTTSYPECCLVGRRYPNGTISWFCTGVLIHPQIVLTAGHCLVPDRKVNVVALGASDQNDLRQAELVNVRRLHVHPRYQETHQLSDMTVLILRTPAATPHVEIAPAARLNAAQHVTLVGFGNEDVNSTKGFGVKREVSVDIVSLRRGPDDALDGDEQRLGYESDYEFVAGGDGFDTCNGDSGGPVYLQGPGARTLVGLTSRATETSVHACGDGGIYTRVDAHLDFIAKVATDAGLAFP